jgi:transcriptional regulator with XRE-family HTH domain
MTPAQCRAARELLGMTQFELAGLAAIPMALIADFELGIRKLRAAELVALQRTLERAGVEFIDDGQTGVRLRKPAQ